jgi:hypothetical protein
MNTAKLRTDPTFNEREDVVLINVHYDVVPNARKDGGWLPRIWVNGRGQGSTFASSGYDRGGAMNAALQLALEESARYCGGYHVELVPGAPKDPVRP